MEKPNDPRSEIMQELTYKWTLTFPGDLTRNEMTKIEKMISQLLKDDFTHLYREKRESKMPSFGNLVTISRKGEVTQYSFRIYENPPQHEILYFILSLGNGLEEIDFSIKIVDSEGTELVYSYKDGKILLSSTVTVGRKVFLQKTTWSQKS